MDLLTQCSKITELVEEMQKINASQQQLNKQMQENFNICLEIIEAELEDLKTEECNEDKIKEEMRAVAVDPTVEATEKNGSATIVVSEITSARGEISSIVAKKMLEIVEVPQFPSHLLVHANVESWNFGGKVKGIITVVGATNLLGLPSKIMP
ncbi:hypothetical protein CJ030_MR2G012415 [Morella rubra]|uniref:Uncharacterized protein n=1 Tax=Morella rubra TaxID=262757 RepID=A0A6A1WIC9_9ROSI|nr:hypothetical protein CJ030_MR2G012415 [Morella rubra]